MAILEKSFTGLQGTISTGKEKNKIKLSRDFELFIYFFYFANFVFWNVFVNNFQFGNVFPNFSEIAETPEMRLRLDF